MSDLLMPSDVPPGASKPAATPAVEPPSVKLIVRLFLIPLFVAVAVVAIMVPIGLMAGSKASLDEALKGLESTGGQRTMSVLLGPGSKQRYLYAKVVVDHMKKAGGLSEAERIGITERLTKILDTPATADDGDVRNLLMLALGRVWQLSPGQAEFVDEPAIKSRQAALGCIVKHIDAKDLENRPAAALAGLTEEERTGLQIQEINMRKAALLATAFWAGRSEVQTAIPAVVGKLLDDREDLDVRISAATALGPTALPGDALAVSALKQVWSGTSEPEKVELVWASALSLAQLNQKQVEPTILSLLDRQDLSSRKVFDRDTDRKNPVWRGLNDAEQQRILINTMLGARKLDSQKVREKIGDIARNDPSSRVKWAASEILKGNTKIDE